MLLTCVCTPIFIHSSVVFVRLYWFEKRFQNIVEDARNLRRLRTRSRTKSEERKDRDIGREEVGISGREIRVLRGSDGSAVKSEAEDEPERAEREERANGDTLKPLATERSREEFPSFHRDITFADEVRTPEGNFSPITRVPEQRSTEEHIKFVENQRNPREDKTLRIPGPRDYDLGYVPQQVDGASDDRIERTATQGQDVPPRSAGGDTTAGGEAGGEAGADGSGHMKRHITIDEPPPRPPGGKVQAGLRAIAGPFTFGAGRKKPERDGMFETLRHRARTRTLASFRSQGRDPDPMPYLSWTPTLGRNSAFVDLTEEQREELGGIEYRALKTLAFILVREWERLLLVAL